MRPKVTDIEDGDTVIFYYDGPGFPHSTYTINVRDVLHDENGEAVAFVSKGNLVYEAKHMTISSVNPYFDSDFT